MTESTIDDGTWNSEGGHPDEGTLHTWLDGALAPADASALETHVAGCDPCQARVAEARGLIAGASRVVRALDSLTATRGGLKDASAGTGGSTSPASIVPAMAPASTPTAGGSMWRLMRVTPTRAAIAAALIVALGITLTRERAAVPTLETAGRGSTLPAASSAPAAAPLSGRLTSPAFDSAAAVASEAAPAIASNAAAPRAATNAARMSAKLPRPDSQVVAAAALSAPDSTLHKAIARRIAADQPPRTIEASPAASAAMPPIVPARASEPGQVADASAGLRVAAGRVAARAAAESAAPPADRARTSALSFARHAGTCYRLERVSPPGALWSGGPLPMTITLTEIPTELRSNGSAGGNVELGATSARAISLPGDDRVVGTWTRRAGDTLSIALRGSSLTTTGLLAPGAGASTSTMRAGTLTATPTGGGTSTTVRVVARPVPCGR